MEESGSLVSPEIPLDETPGSEDTGKRWNLRARKPPPSAEEEEEEEEMEEENIDDEEEEEEEEDVNEEEEEEEEEEEAVQEKPKPRANVKSVAAPSAPVAVAGRKRKAAATSTVKTTVAKRKAVVATVTSRYNGPQTKGKGLYDKVISGRTSLKAVASDWVRRYEQDAESAMLELVQYFVLSCGCRADVTMEMYRGETADVIRTLTENFDEDSGGYPLIASGPGQKKFKALFYSFISLVLENCQNSIVYDEYMLDTLVVWLVGFTDSQVRAFRHTCTVASVKLLSALIDIANNVNYVLDNTQRQVEAERKRQLVKRTETGQAQLEKLVAKRGTLQQNKNELEDVMKGLFSSVFVHRYRDVRAEIRAVCIMELGYWLINYSVKFLADNYLKYVGWMLYDKAGEVRLACLKVLESLYSSNDHAPHLELFTARFKERLLSMKLDADEPTAVAAINVLTYMLSLDLLEPEECVEVCELIFMESRAISHAAGQFSVSYLFSSDFMDRARQKPVPAGKKKPSDGEIQLMELIRFFCEVKIHDHGHYFVDSLWDYCEVLHDWEAVTQLLLDDKSSFTLVDEEIKALVETMTCAARRASGAPLPSGRTRGKVVAIREKRAMEAIKEDMSIHLMTTLPQLITKYGTDSDVATNLISIPQYFDLEIYAEHRLQKHLEDLLYHVHQLTVKHVETTVLDECAQTYHYLLDQEFSLHSSVDVSFRRLVDELVQNFKQLVSECSEEALLEGEDDEEVFSLLLSVRRLSSYYKVQNLSGSKFSEQLVGLLGKGVKQQCPEKIVESVIICLKLEVMWMVHDLKEDQSPSKEALRNVHRKMLRLFKDCEQLVKSGEGCAQREAYVMFTDMLQVFSRLLRRHAHLSSLVYVPEPSLQQTLQDYVVDHVVNSGEDDDVEPATDEEALVMAERLNDRRVLLAAFLKLTMFQVIDAKMAAPIWGYFISQYHNFGDLIRVSMNKCRETNPTGWYKTAISCLTELYLQLKEEGVGYSSDAWGELKELAKKFALSMGFDALKVRQPLVGIHREGIMFAMSRHKASGQVNHSKPPPNLDFLVLLSEFSHRLLMVDRCGERGVLPFLMKQLPEGQFKRIQEGKLPGWGPLISYFKVTQPSTVGAKGKKKGVRGGDVWLSARPSKIPRIDATPPGSEGGSEEGGSESGSPAPVPEGRKTRGRGQQRKPLAHEA